MFMLAITAAKLVLIRKRCFDVKCDIERCIPKILMTYRFCIAISVTESLRGAELCATTAVEVPGPTSGNLLLKEVYSSSVGFWEFLLLMPVSIVSLAAPNGNKSSSIKAPMCCELLYMS